MVFVYDIRPFFVFTYIFLDEWKLNIVVSVDIVVLGYLTIQNHIFWLYYDAQVASVNYLAVSLNIVDLVITPLDPS